jgi:hypothetical protein
LNDSTILLPLLSLVGWTFVVLFYSAYIRFRAGSRGQVTEQDFRVGESARVPPEVSVVNRNVVNLLEVPVLFYVVCIVYYVSGVAVYAFVSMAWTYVALRVLHSFIHLSYNKVMHRMVAFTASTFVLIWMWSVVFRALL